MYSGSKKAQIDTHKLHRQILLMCDMGNVKTNQPDFQRVVNQNKEIKGSFTVSLSDVDSM